MPRKNDVEQIESKVTEPTPRGMKYPVIYLGPTIPHIIKKNTVYANGVPEIVLQEAKKIPELIRLIVPVEKTSQTINEIEKKSSACNVFYKRITDYARGDK